MRKQLDEYIQTHYKKLVSIAQKKAAYYGRNIDGETVLCNAFLSVCNKMPDKADDIPRYLVRSIDCELRYSKSKTMHDATKESKHAQINDEINPTTNDTMICAEFNQSVEAFKRSLDIVDRSVWRVMAEKGLTKVSEMSEHFGISRASASHHRKIVIQKFKEYVESQR